MLSLDWLTFEPIEALRIIHVKNQFHVALQNVAAVGRRFLGSSENDSNATLTWIPGLSRLAGKWVDGTVKFRSSISFIDFSIYLVDERVHTISSFSIQNKTHLQIMLWLEGQIDNLGLTVSDLALKLPYKIQEFPQLNGEVFDLEDMVALQELAKYYHNTFKILRELKKKLKVDGEINVWPHHFDEAVTVVIKDSGDPETNTTITLGMSPGDESIHEPYFYLSTWPHILTSEFAPLNHGKWVEDSWTGAILLSTELLQRSDQEKTLKSYFQDTYHLLVKSLKD